MDKNPPLVLPWAHGRTLNCLDSCQDWVASSKNNTSGGQRDREGAGVERQQTQGGKGKGRRGIGERDSRMEKRERSKARRVRQDAGLKGETKQPTPRASSSFAAYVCASCFCSPLGFYPFHVLPAPIFPPFFAIGAWPPACWPWASWSYHFELCAHLPLPLTLSPLFFTLLPALLLLVVPLLLSITLLCAPVLGACGIHISRAASLPMCLVFCLVLVVLLP